SLPARIAVQSRLGVPWPAMSGDAIEQDARDQAVAIAESLVKAGAYLADKPDLKDEALRRHLSETQMVALIAYLQKLGAYQNVENPPVVPATLNPDARHTTTR